MNTAAQRCALSGRPEHDSTLAAVAGVFAVRDWTKFCDWRWLMRKRMTGRLVTAIIAAGLVGGLALGNPSALAAPEVPPPPAPIDPAAAPAPPPDPFAPPPPADPLAPPPADPLAPPPADPLAASQPTVIPEGTPAGQNPTPYTGQPVFAPPTFNPAN